MKKRLLIVSILLLIIASVIIFAREGGSSVTVAGEDKYNSIKSQTTAVELDFVLSYNGEPLPYDVSSRTFYLPVDMEDPDWEVGSFAGLFENEKKAALIFLEDYTVTNKQTSIAEGREFAFLAVTDSGYGEYKLVFTGLPMITFSGTEYVAEDGSQIFLLRAYDVKHGSGWVTTTYTQSRLRGHVSMNFEKKSLRLYLKDVREDGSIVQDKKNLFGMRDDDDWILNSLYADNTRIRDQLCVDLWNEVGAKSNPYGHNFGTRSMLVEVMIADGYQGIYALMVPIDAKQIGSDSLSEQMAEGNDVLEHIYKKKHTVPWNASSFIGPLEDVTMADYRGGFSLKGDVLLQNEEEWQALHQMASLIEADDETFESEITGVVEQRNVIENWLFYQAIGGFDNLNKNYYYITKNRDGKEFGYFIPWDMNISFGVVYAENEFYVEEDSSVLHQMVPWQPAQRMIDLNVEGSAQLAVSTWERWRSDTFSDEALQERIQALEHQIKDSGAFARECNRWPAGNQNEDFTFIYDFARGRMQAVDMYMNSLID